jgi:hypothetical protein
MRAGSPPDAEFIKSSGVILEACAQDADGCGVVTARAVALASGALIPAIPEGTSTLEPERRSGPESGPARFPRDVGPIAPR